MSGVIEYLGLNMRTPYSSSGICLSFRSSSRNTSCVFSRCRKGMDHCAQSSIRSMSSFFREFRSKGNRSLFSAFSFWSLFQIPKRWPIIFSTSSWLPNSIISSPKTTGSHSLGLINSGMMARPKRKPCRSSILSASSGFTALERSCKMFFLSCVVNMADFINPSLPQSCHNFNLLLPAGVLLLIILLPCSPNLVFSLGFAFFNFSVFQTR